MDFICMHRFGVRLHYCFTAGSGADSIFHRNRFVEELILSNRSLKSLNSLEELFESGPRPAAMALGSLSLWTCNFIVAMAFPSLQEVWGALVFVPFAVICFALTALIKFYLPETRGLDSSVIAPLVADGFKSKPLRRKNFE